MLMKLAIVLALIPEGVLAQNAQLDRESQTALEQTQKLLRDQQQRDAAISEAPAAQTNHQDIQKLVGAGANTDAVYGISADVLAAIVKEAGGDTVALQKRLVEAQKDPQAFLRSLPADLRAKIKGLSNRVEGEQPSIRP